MKTGEAMDTQDYAALTTKEAKAEAIQAATSVEELDAMWAAWEKQGWSRAGLLYAVVLQRKSELGHELSDLEKGTVNLAALKQREGAKLPPIRGQLGDPGAAPSTPTE